MHRYWNRLFLFTNMPKDTFYFSHDYHARSDRKILRLRMKHGMVGVGIYWCVVEMLYEESGYLLHSDYERISFELQADVRVVTSVLRDFELFEYNDENFWSESVLNRLKKRADKSEKARASINERWEREREKKRTNELRTNYDINTIKESKPFINIVKQNENGKNEKQLNGNYPPDKSIWANGLGDELQKDYQSRNKNSGSKE